METLHLKCTTCQIGICAYSKAKGYASFLSFQSKLTIKSYLNLTAKPKKSAILFLDYPPRVIGVAFSDKISASNTKSWPVASNDKIFKREKDQDTIWYQGDQ